MYEIKEISKEDAYGLIFKFHYGNCLPRLTKHCIGGYIDNELVAVMTLGWGVRPLHTIRKLFPSLETADYYENGRLCLDEKMPRNSESQFISEVVKYIKINFPNIKVLFSWSDGMLGKAGYVYQASNFLYGGFIWTDSYFSKQGEKVHPRQTNRIGGRPSWCKMQEMGWMHYKGKQFRYCLFLCSNKQRKRLIKESTVKWSIEYPKEKDLSWKIKCVSDWQPANKPFYNKLELKYNTKQKAKRNEILNK